MRANLVRVAILEAHKSGEGGGTRYNSSNIIESYRSGGLGVLVQGGIMPGCCINFHTFEENSVTGAHYCNEILLL